MNKLFHVLSIFCLIAISLNTIQAQNQELEDTSLKGMAYKFPPLQVVIDAAIKKSAMVNFRKNSTRSKEATLATERIHWSRNLGAQIDTKYGNLNNFSTNDDGSGTSAVLTTVQQFTYGAGFYLKFPLFDGLNRKNQIELAKAEVDAAKDMIELEKEQIRQKVIALYQELILKQKLLQIRSRSLGDGRVNMQMVEKEFRNGVVPISEYVRISSMTTDMEAAYETAMSEFITTKQLLEDLSGFVFDLTYSN